MNLLRETVDELHGIGRDDITGIAFIGSYDGKYGCTWEEFENSQTLNMTKVMVRRKYQETW